MTGLILTHYTAKPFVLDRTRTYDQSEFGNGKPRGLWLSDDFDHGWAAWCREEEFMRDSLLHATNYTITPGARVLRLETAEDLRGFTIMYRGHPEFRGAGGTSLGSHWIDWPRVASEYSGILITPYQWLARLDRDFMWYYGWDCASACIWDLTAIEQLEVAA